MTGGLPPECRPTRTDPATAAMAEEFAFSHRSELRRIENLSFDQQDDEGLQRIQAVQEPERIVLKPLHAIGDGKQVAG